MSTAEALPAAPRQHHELDRLAVLMMLLICIIWGFNQISIKLASAGIAPVLQSALRSAGATVLLFLWCRSRGIALFTRDGTIVPGIAAGLLFAVQFLLMYWGLGFTTVSRAMIFIYTAPFAVALGAHFLVPDDRLTIVKTIGLVSAFAGLAVAFADGLRLPTRGELVGDAMCFAGAIASAATTVLIKASRLARASAEKTLLYQLAVSVPLLAAAVPFFEGSLDLSLTPLVAAAMLYQTLVVAFASYVAWFWLMRSYPASRLSAFTFLTPALGVLFGGLLLGEQITTALVAAVVFIAAGLFLVNRPAPGS